MNVVARSAKPVKLIVVSCLMCTLTGCFSLFSPASKSGSAYNEPLIAAQEPVSFPRATVAPVASAPPETSPQSSHNQSLVVSRHQRAASQAPAPQRSVAEQANLSYENATINEDVTWRGTVLIRGSLAVAPPATVRIEPGTTVRFMKSAIRRQSPRLVVSGRIHCNGTPEKPVQFIPNSRQSTEGEWGGILMLSSEKRNLFDHVRIEGAEVGIESYSSSITINNTSIDYSTRGIVLRDSTANILQLTIRGAETALDISDSEVELKHSTLSDNRNGITAAHSTLILQSTVIRGSMLSGINAVDCRTKITTATLSGNTIGAILKGGEGQLVRSRFLANRETALHLSGSRQKIQRNLFEHNQREALRLDDGRALVWGNIFSNSGSFHLVYTGQERISAVQNWWGSADESAVRSAVCNQSQESCSHNLTVFPWLSEKPVILP